MTIEQVTALLCSPPGDYTVGLGTYVAFIDAIGADAMRRAYPICWCGSHGAIGLVPGKDGLVDHAEWYPAVNPPNDR